MKKQFTLRLEQNEITALKNLAKTYMPSVTASALARQIIIEYLEKKSDNTNKQR